MRTLAFALLGLLSVTMGCCCRCDRCKADDGNNARVAFALASALHARPASVCDCIKSGVCHCDPANCRCCEGCVRQCSDEKEEETKALGGFVAYKIGRAKVAKDGGRLVVWVGGVCGICVKKLSDHYHCRVASWEGVDGVGVVLIEGDGKGEAVVLKKWDGFPPASEIRDTRIKRKESRLQDEQPSHIQPSYAQPVYYSQPQLFAPSPVVYYGLQPSFGGGGCAGGCCGGSCR